MVVMKYNPGFLTDDELVESFCIRIPEFTSIIEMLRECDGSSNPHRLVIGPRGYGKTNLLLRVAIEIRRNLELSLSFFPIVFAEESYRVLTADEFWLEALSLLAEQAPSLEDKNDLRLTFEELRKIRNDPTLGKRCLGHLLDFSNRHGKRLVLIVENLNMMFRDMAEQDGGWKLRQTLQTEPRIILLASATSRFSEISNPDHAFYDLFVTRVLPSLSTEECATLWENVSGQYRSPEAMRGLRILTGGNPRLLSIVAQFGARLSFRDLMGDLLKLIDDLTEYFRNHIEALPPQERLAYLALAELWEPATAREVAVLARLDTNKCSAHLNRLVDRGVVDIAGGSARRKLYYLAERLYNIYYLLRRSRTPTPLIEAFVRFMDAYYSPPELKDIGSRMVRDAGGLEPERKTLHWTAFARLIDLPVLASYRNELLSIAPEEFTKNFRLEEKPMKTEESLTTGQRQAGDMTTATGSILHRSETNDLPLSSVEDAEATVNKGISFIQRHNYAEAVVTFEEVVRRFGNSTTPAVYVQVARALLNKGFALGELNQLDSELAAYEEVVHRFRDSSEPTLLYMAANAIVRKVFVLGKLDRLEKGVSACDELVERFGDSSVPEVVEQLAIASLLKGIKLNKLSRLEEAIIAYDKLVARFGDNDAPTICALVAEALNNKATILSQLNQLNEKLSVCDEIIRRFGDSNEPLFIEHLARVVLFKGATLGKLNRPTEAIAAYDEIVRRFDSSDAPVVLEGAAAQALFDKGRVLNESSRLEEAIAVSNEVVQRFGDNESPEIQEIVARSLFRKGDVLINLNNPEEAIVACDEAVRRFCDSDVSGMDEIVAQILVNKASALVGLNRLEDTVVTCDEVVRRFGTCDAHVINAQVAYSLVLKGSALIGLNQIQEAKMAWEEVVKRFGMSENTELNSAVGTAFLQIADSAREQGDLEEAMKAVEQLFDRSNEQTSSHWCEGYLIRAQASVADGNVSQAEDDIKEALALLPDFGFLLNKTIDVLMDFTVLQGAIHTNELIQASPSAEQLLPFTTALDKELGNKPRVAREIEEIAEDILEDLGKRRKSH